MNKTSKNERFIKNKILNKSMKEKKFILPLMVAFGLLLLMSFATAAITFNTPSTAGDTVTGTYTFNVTTDATSALNITWATTGDGIFNSTINATAGQTEWIAVLDTSSLTEVEDTTLTVNITNTTGSETSTLTINIDNANPVCTFTVDKDIVEYLDAIGIATTQSSTDTTDLTYAWILYRSDNTQAATSASSAPTFDDGDFDLVDEFRLSLIVTDEASLSTACTNQTIMVTGTDDDDLIIGTTTFGGMFKENRMLILGGGVILMLVICVVVILMINKTKKGGR